MEEMDLYNEVARESETRANGSQIHTEAYSREVIERLRNIVIMFFKQGERKFYSISVDGEIVVPRTSDGRKFNRYLPFVNKHTQMVEVKMFLGNSPNCNRYQFYMNQGLSGLNQPVDVQAEIDRALEEQALNNEVQELRKELSKKKRKLKKIKKQNKDSGSDWDLKSLIQGGKELFGAFRSGPDNQLKGTVPQPEAEVEVEVENEPELDENQKIYNELLEKVGNKGIKKALRVMAMLSAHPELENKLLEELNKNTEEDGQA